MGRKRKKAGLAEQLRAAICESGVSRYGLAKQTGLSYAVVHRFVAGERDITLATATKITKVLGLELRPVQGGERKGR